MLKVGMKQQLLEGLFTDTCLSFCKGNMKELRDQNCLVSNSFTFQGE